MFVTLLRVFQCFVALAGGDGHNFRFAQFETLGGTCFHRAFGGHQYGTDLHTARTKLPTAVGDFLVAATSRRYDCNRLGLLSGSDDKEQKQCKRRDIHMVEEWGKGLCWLMVCSEAGIYALLKVCLPRNRGQGKKQHELSEKLSAIVGHFRHAFV